MRSSGTNPPPARPGWLTRGRRGARRSGINKPVAVLDWLEKAQPREEYILILDADMIMRRPFEPVRLGVRPGAPPPAAPVTGRLRRAPRVSGAERAARPRGIARAGFGALQLAPAAALSAGTRLLEL